LDDSEEIANVFVYFSFSFDSLRSAQACCMGNTMFKVGEGTGVGMMKQILGAFGMARLR
jgi:hypothetical protein